MEVTVADRDVVADSTCERPVARRGWVGLLGALDANGLVNSLGFDPDSVARRDAPPGGRAVMATKKLRSSAAMRTSENQSDSSNQSETWTYLS